MMKAMDLVKRMEALRPDSMDVLDLLDTNTNCYIRIWREYADTEHTTAYYRIRIDGYQGLVGELFPDIVTAAMSGIQLYSLTDDDTDETLTGDLNVEHWKVRGE